MGRHLHRSKIVKSIRNIVISVVVLLVLIMGAGIGYTWYVGQTDVKNNSAIAESAEYKPTPAIKRVAPAPNAKIGASVQAIASPVAVGANTSITVKTNPDVACSISVVYDKTASTDSGLKPKVADEYGIVTWAWTVDDTAAIGKWPVKVTCARDKQSAVVHGDLQVVRQIN